MDSLSYGYASCVRSSEKAAWSLDDVMPAGTRLDFARPFLPEALVSTAAVGFLDHDERLALNHISGNAYLNLFGFIEEYVIAMTIQHAEAELFGDHDAIRALVRFADEEIKHQALFKRYRASFDRDFGHDCEVIGNAADVAGIILAKSPLAVTTVTLQLELITQEHYLESIRENKDLDPFFCKLLKYHWMEESQHARIDVLELHKMAEASHGNARARALADYLEITHALDGLLEEQAVMDERSLSSALGRTFSADESARLQASQHANYRHAFLAAKTFGAGLRSAGPRRFDTLASRRALPSTRRVPARR
jgi:hypothetical protein